ncbi:hypothetical protein X801_02454 [Opisthorchis viverrini]|uniref:Peptidase M3A/M3B catalytic domain-containing protein n=1 Tax=Opisthorchis viverrini TaxID=6198 RepID=A0A1S8X4J5_OPIVI|nr:hypothetical protein X801_02454 [Opisthorchis viverrini]
MEGKIGLEPMLMDICFTAQPTCTSWSEVFSADLYESRFRHAPDGGCLSKTVGREYRTKILQPGGSKDASDMLRDFLGRDPNNSAFFKLLGIQV